MNSNPRVSVWDLLRRLTVSWLQYPRRADKKTEVLQRISEQFVPAYDPPGLPPVAGVGLKGENKVVVFLNSQDHSIRQDAIEELTGTSDVSIESKYTGDFSPCLTAGDSIGFGSGGGSTGTGGTLADDIAGSTFILSCNHVIAATNKGITGTSEVWSPGSADGGTATDRVGLLYDYEPLHLDGITPNTMDAAIAQPDSGIVLSKFIPQIGAIGGTHRSPPFNHPVKKYGKKSQLTSGTLTVKNLSILVKFGGQSALFVDQYGIIGAYPPFAEDGDSGSLVVDDNNDAIGLIFAISGTGEFVIVNPIDPILSRFGLCF